MPHHGLTPPLRYLLALVVWTIGRLVWRLYRAHVNALENLPLFVAVVLAAEAAGLHSPTLDVLAALYVAARVAHSLAHVSPGAGLKWNLRLVLLAAQVICLLGMTATILGAA